MKSTDSFYATIAFGLLALVLLAVAALYLDHAVALVLVCAAACVAYLAQYASTIALYHLDAAEKAHIDDEETMIDSIARSRRATVVATAFVMLAAACGAWALILLALAVL